MKACSKCGIEKDENEFVKNKKYRDGFELSCKMCRKIYNQSEKHKECLKKYRQSEKFEEYLKKYRQSEKHKEYQKKYQKKYKQLEKYKKYHKEYKQSENGKKTDIKYLLKRQIGETPPPELVEIKLLIYKTKKSLCETSKN